MSLYYLSSIIGAYFIFILIFAILKIVANWMIFTKAGEEGWKSLIPFYNSYIFYKIVWDTNMFWITLIGGMLTASLTIEGTLLYYSSSVLNTLFSAVIGITLFAITILFKFKTSKCFGQSDGFAIGLILLPSIFQLILAFGSAQYIGNERNRPQIPYQ